MKRFGTWLLGLVVVFASLWFFVFRGDGEEPEIEYRYEAAKVGELTRSTSATGTVVPLTTVDVKSKAGGIVERLYVDEGAVVKKGDLVAEIDPRDTKAAFEQAQADLRQAEARADQAGMNLDLQKRNTRTSLATAQAALESAKLRLERAQIESKRQPTTSTSSLTSARAAYESAQAELERFQTVTKLQQRRDTEGGYNRARADLDAAKADFERQKGLLQRGYVSQAVVERAKASLESAQASFDTAQQKRQSLERDLSAQEKALTFAVTRSRAQFEQANGDMAQIDISQRNLAEAKKAVEVATLDLQRAKDAAKNDQLRASERVASEAATVRSKVSLDNAKVQLESTTVMAPRDGVVTLKYLEEGTIIPPGTSTFSQGTSIVQISDVTTLFVDCNVDEADIGSVRKGQSVYIRTEAHPGMQLNGVVERVNPSATTTNNITAVKVRVRVLPNQKLSLMPGLTASCEFLTFSKKNALIVPSQAIQREGEKTYVKVKGKDPKKPVRKEVKVGASGDNGVEILEGIQAGDEIVTAEIDLAQLRDIQQKMQEAQEGGGLAGGQGPKMRPQGGAGRMGGGGMGGGGKMGGGR
ncbi:MAG: efflux RND transporter periplasmic adaptor subunit [Armatimonadetes bacterium]|nr:efflux RND transporter periplasmic adaptor subunit [Armatimonadota bacterium]